jgi:hypothetical protein
MRANRTGATALLEPAFFKLVENAGLIIDPDRSGMLGEFLKPPRNFYAAGFTGR